MAFKALNVEDIKAKLNKGYEVELSGFRENDPDDTFPCILKDIDLVSWMIHGKIPNELAAAVEELFDVTVKQDSKKAAELLNTAAKMKDHTQILEWMASESLVEPKYSDLEEAGVFLTQKQLNEIYVFQTQGVAALKTFRNLYRNAEAGLGGDAV